MRIGFDMSPWMAVAAVAGVALAMAVAPVRGDQPPRCSLWIDACQGEPLSYQAVLDDLAEVRVIYLGERHTLQRHHDLQAQIVADLAKRGVKLAVGLEQLEAFQQPQADQFNAGQCDVDQLAAAVGWGRRWPNWAQYRAVLEAAQAAGAPIVALNARTETIRQVARGGGVGQLSAELRQQLPAAMQLDDPAYAKLLAQQMMVHMAADQERLRPMIEAQIARDETMADSLARFLQSAAGRGRTAIVICGSGHVAYGLGTPARVATRLPGAKDRVIIFSESGDVELTAEERAVSRPIEITHDQWRAIGRPVADYLYVTTPKAPATSPATH